MPAWPRSNRVLAYEPTVCAVQYNIVISVLKNVCGGITIASKVPTLVDMTAPHYFLDSLAFLNQCLSSAQSITLATRRMKCVLTYAMDGTAAQYMERLRPFILEYIISCVHGHNSVYDYTSGSIAFLTLRSVVLAYDVRCHLSDPLFLR